MKRKYTVLALAALMTATACADLDEHPVTGVASDYFQTAAGANAAVTGTYSQLRGYLRR